MASTRLQLAVKGKACNFLTSQPEISLFKTAFRRYSNFASNSEELQLLPRVEFGQKVECVLQPIGDLISSVYLMIRLPRFDTLDDLKDKDKDKYNWIENVAYHLIESCTLHIGSQLVCTLNSMFIYINNCINSTHQENIDNSKLIDSKNPIIYLKLPFWFSKHIGLSLPVFGIKSPIKVVIKFRDLNELYTGPSNLRISNNRMILNTSLLVNYIFLDENERNEFASSKLKYLIEQPQVITNVMFNEHENFGKVALNFNNAVFQLMWIVQKNDLMSWKKKVHKSEDFEYEEDDEMESGNDWYNFELDNKFDSFERGKIVINGTDRTNNLPASYYRLIQNKEHCANVPENNIYSYNFGLQNMNNQPSGAINFNNCSNVVLIMEFNNNLYKKNVTVFAKNYNLLKIEKGNVEIKF